MLSYPLEEDFVEGRFLERVNRFVIKAKIAGKEAFAYLPNPGRLWELLIKGRKLLLLSRSSSHSSLKYLTFAVKKEDLWVLLHTHYTNRVVSALIKEGNIPELKGYRVLKREPKFNSSRFDLLLESPSGERLFLEVKTCTLFGKRGAMFPDAPSKRATRHLLHLEKLPEGTKGAIFFAVMSPDVDYFLPAYHIDPEFAEVFLKAYKNIRVFAYGFKWSRDFRRVEALKSLKLPIELLKKEFKNSGSYLLVLYLEKEEWIEKFGRSFAPGYYVYVGSAMKNLKQRIARHMRKRKKLKWHIDYFLAKAKLEKAVPILSSKRLECTLARDVSSISEGYIPKFGSSDCSCASHLFYFSRNPLLNENFQELLVYYRIDRLFE